MKSERELTMASQLKIVELGNKFKSLRDKFNELDAKARQAADAAEMAMEAMHQAQLELLAACAGITADEYVSDSICPDCGE